MAKQPKQPKKMDKAAGFLPRKGLWRYDEKERLMKAIRECNALYKNPAHCQRSIAKKVQSRDKFQVKNYLLRNNIVIVYKNHPVNLNEEGRMVFVVPASTFNEMNDADLDMVQTKMDEDGHSDDKIVDDGQNIVRRLSLHTLQPRVWLNDEIIHYFNFMLSKRDKQLCMDDPDHRRSHFFQSFFITKLLDEDGYQYQHVSKWSRKVPGKDIFKLDKIFIPINMGNLH